MEEFDDANRGATSSVHAVMTAGLFFAIGFQGQILRRFKIPHIIRAGTLISSVGLFLSALATQLWQLYFTSSWGSGEESHFPTVHSAS